MSGRHLPGLCGAVLVSFATACGAGAVGAPANEADAADDIDVTPVAVLDCAQPPDASMPACDALALAGGNDAERARLLARLADPAYLEEIEPEDVSTYDELVFYRVVQRLAGSPEWLPRLIPIDAIQSDALHMQALLYGLALIRPPAPPTLTYWRQLAGPDSPLAYDVIEAALANGSDASYALVGDLLADPAHPDAEKIAWLREALVPRRNEPVLLAAALSWLQTGLDEPVSEGLVEAIFEYEPAAWYHTPDPPRPPASDIPPEARRYRQAIARWAQDHLPLSGGLRRSVESAASGS